MIRIMDSSTTAPEPVPARANGQARRRARTRAALLDAGLGLLAEGREQASIEEITRRAGVGFGSFYNHFDSKEELFAEALLSVLDTYAAWIREATADVADPAEVFGRSFRLTGRLALGAPELFAPLLAHGTGLLGMDRGLQLAALEDLRRGVAAGRFGPLAPPVLLALAGGALLGLLQLIQDDPAAVDVGTVDAAAEGVLRMFGVDAVEAADIVRRPLPDNPAVALAAAHAGEQG